MPTVKAEALGKVLIEEASSLISGVVGLAATTQVVNIKGRVEGGIGVNDSRMEEYSKPYERKKKKSGRQASLRDLSWTGRMMGALHSEIEGDNVAVVTFADTFSMEKARWNHERTPWFGVSPNDLALIEKAVAEFINKKEK